MDLIEIGQIVNTHGVRGEVKVNSWIDDLNEFCDFEKYFYKKNGEYIELTLDKLRFHKNCAIIKFKEIKDMTEAETFKGTVLLSLKNKNLPEGVFYVGDLIGIKVFAMEREIGEISDVFKTGASDVYTVKTSDGKEVYIPAVREFIKNIDLDNKTMEINLIDGLLD
ncbi:MAG: 16S rRNA processing protein RimM [Ruminococcaceae bacterium]|nr:16S rRNA processing protein RimM [Oscillospiraceae bacterium]